MNNVYPFFGMKMKEHLELDFIIYTRGGGGGGVMIF